MISPEPTGPGHQKPRPRTGSRVFRRVVAIAILIPLLTGLLGAPVTSGDELSDALAQQKALAAKIAAEKKQVAALRERQAGLQADLAATRQALKQVNADLATVKKRIATMSERVNAARAQYYDLAAQVVEWDKLLAGLQAQELAKAAELGKRRVLLAERIRAAYLTGQTSLLETILSAESFTDVLSDVSSYVDFSAQDKALADQIEKDKETLESLRQSTKDVRAETQELRVEARDQKIALDARLDDLRIAREDLKKLEKETARQLAIQQNAYAKLAASEKDLKSLIAKQQAAQAALKRKIDELVAAQFRGGNIPSVYNGSLSWPLAGTITQEFGCTGVIWEPSVGNCSHFHDGIDIADPMYTPIRAAGSGVVVFAGANPYDPYPKAWIVIIAHSQNLVTWYAHVDNATNPPAVHAGDLVTTGQVIAYVGMTGRTTGPHLHWAVEFERRVRQPAALRLILAPGGAPGPRSARGPAETNRQAPAGPTVDPVVASAAGPVAP